MGSLVEYSGAMKSLTNYMPGIDTVEGIPGKMDPIVDMNGSREGVDARESFSKLHATVSSMNRGVSRLCSTIPMRHKRFRKTDEEAQKSKGQTDTDRNGVTPGFSKERSHLQDLINRQVAADASAATYVEDGKLRNIASFLLRLKSITGKDVTELTGSLSDIGVRDWIEDFRRMGGMHIFSVLESLANRRLAEKGPLMSGYPADIARRIFEQGVLFSSVENVDAYAGQMTEKKFLDATQLFEKATLFGAAVIASDLAARVWDRLDRTGLNPHAAETARLIHRSIEHDPDRTTFGIRYLYGLHYAGRAADWAAKQRLFGASIAFYDHRGLKREVAHASIREAHAFSQRKDRVTDAEWKTISEHLSMALSSFNKGTWMGHDAETFKSLKEAKEEAGRYASRLN